MTIRDLPTPALLVDLAALEANIAAMARHAGANHKRLRPHAKAHKCVEIARRQMAAGAIGLCAATVPEAELLVRAGLRGVLLTSPLADPNKIRRIARLSSTAPDLMVVADHPEQVRMYEFAAEAEGATVNVLVDVDVGDHRTGTAPGAPALRLAHAILDQSRLRFRGLQAYGVKASHVAQSERREFSAAALRAAVETRRLLESEGIAVEIVTGGSTGTYRVDAEGPVLTELQAGSYVFMDGAYARIGGIGFAHSLQVLATVISANQPDRVTVDAGYKAFSTDRPFGPDPLQCAGARYEWAGDEFGFLFLEGAAQPVRLGDRIRFIPPHCDPTVNLYDRLYVMSGDSVVDMWPIMDRPGSSALTTS
jgi:D-serine deaminase-like pyridoxal phosphate-dependent protein